MTIPPEDVLADLQRVAEKVGEPPSRGQYAEFGEYSTSTIYANFDGICEARRKAGIDGSDQRGVNQELGRQELLEAIHDLADELGRAPKREEMIDQGEFSEGPYRREFGSWGKAVTVAGYEPHRPNSELAERIEVTCAWCDLTEEVLSSQNQNQTRWFCSKPCKHRWQAENVVGEDHHQYNRVTVSCDYCGDTDRRKPAVAESRDHHFCNYDCYGSWCSTNRTGDSHPRWNGGEMTIECDICGTERQVRQAKASNARFCSVDCLGAARETELIGSNNPNYIDGTTTHYGPNWEQEREQRLKKDNYSCVVCGTSREEHQQEFGRDLAVHHVTPRREFVTDGELDYHESNRIQNLRTMCAVHHKKWEGVPIAPETAD